MVGYFAQHQLDSLDAKASPLLHLQRLAPTEREQTLRDFLGGFDFRGARIDEPVLNFSGGEKARLALALIAWDRPNLLLLDEPTNHLDLEMRLALTMALQEFSGAVLVVSHDRHLLKSTTDNFLLVADGKVEEFDGDLDDYARWLTEYRLRNAPASNTPVNPTKPTRKPSARPPPRCASSWHRTSAKPTSWKPNWARCMSAWPRSKPAWATALCTRRRARTSCVTCWPNRPSSRCARGNWRKPGWRPRVARNPASAAGGAVLMEALQLPVPVQWIEPIWIGVQILLILLAGYLAQRFVAKGLTRLGERYPFPPQLLMPLRGGLRWLIMGSALILCWAAWVCLPRCCGRPCRGLSRWRPWRSSPCGRCCPTCCARS